MQDVFRGICQVNSHVWNPLLTRESSFRAGHVGGPPRMGLMGNRWFSVDGAETEEDTHEIMYYAMR